MHIYKILITFIIIFLIIFSLSFPSLAIDASSYVWSSTIDDSLLANVIIDGKIVYGNLQYFQKDEAWLHNELKKQNASIKDILLATINENSELAIHVRKDMHLKRVPFV